MTPTSTTHDQATLGSGRPISDGELLRSTLKGGLSWLEQHTEAINALNVFPVPDGDTGTNMVLTLRAALTEAGNGAPHDLAAVARSISRGALMGARGNSGVILSQLLRGMSSAFEAAGVLTARSVAEAFASARDTAYKGVMRPVEGTILTVAKEIAASTTRAARNENLDITDILAVAVEAARHAVATTPRLLPVLAQAGVVDAGGQGLLIIVEGMHRYLGGQSVESDEEMQQSVDLVAFDAADEYGYDIQFLVHGEDLDVDAMRQHLTHLGDSLLVVGDSNTVKVHIHSPMPGDAINYGASLGSLADVVVENMQEQYRTFMAQRTTGGESTDPTRPIGVVAVSQGEGFRRVLESLGADLVVEGGQTMNPSVEEILAAVSSLPQADVIILPNNSNVVMAAGQAAPLSDKSIHVVPTRTVPEGIGALLSANYDLSLAENAEAMIAGAKLVRTIEVTIATRTATVNNVKVREGEFIALLDTELVATGKDMLKVALRALRDVEAGEREIATVYTGEDATEASTTALREAISKKYPDLEIEIVDSGQPHYHYVIGVE